MIREIIVQKGEIAQHEQFLLLPHEVFCYRSITCSLHYSECKYSISKINYLNPLPVLRNVQQTTLKHQHKMTQISGNKEITGKKV